jgi:pimeloyl-ACP methyl ester carboxylesterase
MEREIQLPQGVVRYRDVGQGEPIVFVHGLLTDGRLWDGVVGHLGQGVRCIVPDWPLGSHLIPMKRRADMSPRGVARMVGDFMAALDLRGVTLVGNDTGGAICQIVATSRPDRIGRLVLTNCDAFENFPPPMFQYLSMVARVPLGLAVLGQGMRPTLAHRLPFAYGWLTESKIPRGLTTSWTRPVRVDRHVRRDLRRFLRAVNSDATVAAAERLTRFDRPALIAWGTEDRFFPMEHGERLAALIPGARLERIEGAATFVPLDQPGQLGSLLAAFVSEGTAARPAGATS